MSEHKRDAARDLRLMPCEAGGRSYYLDAAAVRSIHRKSEWRLNWRSDTPLGWIRHDGGEIPILDLARALGVTHATVAVNAVVVETETGPKAWGVGGVGRVEAWPGERILPVPEACWTEDSPPWIGVAAGEGTPSLCVSPEQLGQGRRASVRAAQSFGSAAARSQATGRAILFSAFDGKGRLPEFRFCLGFAQVAEFVIAPALAAVPAGRPWLNGLIVWRGRSVPAIDLRWGITGQADAGQTRDYLVVRANAQGELAAVPVFGKPEAVDLPFECEREPSPPVTSPAWFGASFKRRHQLFLTPDFAAILSAERS